jgi:two-component system invasion response regulator UvrY
MKRILVIDDHEIVKAGIESFIGQLIPGAITDGATNGKSALEKIASYAYDLILMDVNISGTESYGVASKILAEKPAANILMFTMSKETVYAKKYLMLGIKGYISKTASEQELANAIDKVMQNKRYISPALNELLIDDVLGKRPANPFDDLSPREMEIFQRTMRGETPAEIHANLDLSFSTINTYRIRIYKKLNCKTIIELGILAKVYDMLDK